MISEPASFNLTEAVDCVCARIPEEISTADRLAAFPVGVLAEMRRTGLLGLIVPARYGGANGTLQQFVDVTIRLGRDDAAVALIFAMHCQQVAALVRHASDALRERILPEISAGRMYIASVTSETTHDGGLLQCDVPSTAEGGALEIDRDAPMVTGGKHADAFLITMQTAKADSPTVVDLIFARRDQLQIDVLGDWDALGMRATESIPLRLRGVVPESQIVGSPGGFRAIAVETFAPLAHIGWAASWLGSAAGALSRVLGHVRSVERGRQFGRDSELVLARLGTLRTQLDAVHGLLRHTVRVYESTQDVAAVPVQLLVNALKVEASQSCYRIVDELLDVVGLRLGYASRSELHLERSLRDLRSASLNYSNDRLRVTNGALALRDTAVTLA